MKQNHPREESAVAPSPPFGSVRIARHLPRIAAARSLRPRCSMSALAIRHSLRRSDRNHWVSRFSLPIRERSAKETVLGHSLAMTRVAGRTLQAILVYTRSVSVFITGCPEMDDTN
jgi:hypothetical protein